MAHQNLEQRGERITLTIHTHINTHSALIGPWMARLPLLRRPKRSGGNVPLMEINRLTKTGSIKEAILPQGSLSTHL